MTLEKPDILEDIQKKAAFLVKKWGVHPVRIRLSTEDHRKISRYMSRADLSETSLSPSEKEKDGPSIHMKFNPVQDMPEGSLVMKIEKDSDEDGDLIKA